MRLGNEYPCSQAYGMPPDTIQLTTGMTTERDWLDSTRYSPHLTLDLLSDHHLGIGTHGTTVGESSIW